MSVRRDTTFVGKRSQLCLFTPTVPIKLSDRSGNEFAGVGFPKEVSNFHFFSIFDARSATFWQSRFHDSRYKECKTGAAKQQCRTAPPPFGAERAAYRDERGAQKTGTLCAASQQCGHARRGAARPPGSGFHPRGFSKIFFAPLGYLVFMHAGEQSSVRC